MAHCKMKRLTALAVGTSLLVGSFAHAQTAPQVAPASSPQAAPVGDNSVSEVVVKGSKLPDALATKAATCEALIQKDPSFRALIAASRGKGAMMGPRILLPTRAARNPDYAAAPLSQPGSPIPEVSARWRGKRLDNTINASITTEGAAPVGGMDGAPSELAALFGGANAAQVSGAESTTGGFDLNQTEGLDNLSIDEAVAACRGFYTPGGGAVSAGRADISGRDKTLPTALVLFDEGRYEEALGFFQQAYRKLPLGDGGDEAALMIGKIHLFAMGEKSDPKQGVMWLKRAGEAAFNPVTSTPVFDPKTPNNNTAMGEAALLLGQLYVTGSAGVERDPVQARKWFARSFDVGHVRAAKMLGDLHYAGVGGPKDVRKAFDEYTKAATLGYAPAQYALGEMYYTGDYGGAADKAKAVAWYNEAAKVEHPDALYALAGAYDAGDGIPADPQKAVALYKTAALKGNVAAMTAMGTYFYEGAQVTKSDTTARQWFQTAAAAGDPDAMFNLAAMMMKGEGGAVDRTKAWVWFKLAQAKGVATASPAIAALERQMTAEEKSSAMTLLSPKTS